MDINTILEKASSVELLDFKEDSPSGFPMMTVAISFGDAAIQIQNRHPGDCEKTRTNIENGVFVWPECDIELEFYDIEADPAGIGVFDQETSEWHDIREDARDALIGYAERMMAEAHPVATLIKAEAEWRDFREYAEQKIAEADGR